MFQGSESVVLGFGVIVLDSESIVYYVVFFVVAASSAAFTWGRLKLTWQYYTFLFCLFVCFAFVHYMIYV